VSRRVWAALAVVVIVAAGLLTRSGWAALPGFVVTWGGDTLWAAMVYAILATLRPTDPVRRLALLAGGFALLIEVSQLYQADWIVAVRANRLAALVLGHGFLWSDLACYAVGVAGAALVDRVLSADR
jgi:hypothetical protein